MEIQIDSDNKPYVLWGNLKIHLELESIENDNFFVEKARNELRETPEIVKESLKEFKKLLKEEEDLNIPSDDEEYLIKFLRPCKFYTRSALQRIKHYYEFRRSHPTYCKDLLPSKTRKTFEQSIISVLTPRDQHGRRIMLVESGEKWKPSEIPLSELFRGVQLALESAMVEPKTQVAGVIVLCDMKGLSFSHVMQYTPSFAKMVIDWIQDCIPIRLKAVHIVNQPFIFNMLFAIFKPFLSEKLRSRLHFHGTNFNTLLKHIDASALRKRHGGTLPEPEIPGDIMYKMLAHYEPEFEQSNSYGYPDKKK